MELWETNCGLEQSIAQLLAVSDWLVIKKEKIIPSVLNVVLIIVCYDDWDSEFPPERKEIEEKLEFSSDSKKLKIKLQIPRITWDPIAALVGNELTELKLVYDPTFSGSSGRPGRIPGFDAFVFRFQGSLKLLQLEHISTLNDMSNSLQESSFSSLKSLVLCNVGDSILDFFSDITSPSLRYISITSAGTTQAASKCLLSLLECHSSRLIRLDFRAGWRLVGQGVTPNLSFPNLKHLKLSSKTSRNASASTFFLQFTFPALIKIQPASLKQRLSKAAPKLVESKMNGMRGRRRELGVERRWSD